MAKKDNFNKYLKIITEVYDVNPRTRYIRTAANSSFEIPHFGPEGLWFETIKLKTVKNLKLGRSEIGNVVYYKEI